MSIVISWANYNPHVTSIEIFKSTNQISDASPGTLAVTLEPNKTSWIDTEPRLGDTRFYRIVFVSASARMYGVPFQVTSATDTGPGGSEILLGNSVFGFMGTITSSELKYDFSDFGYSAPSFYKFIHNGRILITPGLVYTTELTPANLRDKKILSSGVTQAYGNASDLETQSEIIASGRRYYPRIAKFFDHANSDLDVANYGAGAGSKRRVGKSEFVDLYLATVGAYPDFTALTPFRLGSTFTPTTSNSSRTAACDYTNAARTTIIGITQHELTDAPTSTIVSAQQMKYAIRNSIPILEYIGVK